MQNAIRPIFILGAGGFVGKHIAIGLRTCCDKIVPLVKAEFELGKFADYSKYSFSNSIIIDCISRIDSTPGEVYDNNVVKLATFIDFLNNQHKDFVYVYFSTLSTADEKVKEQNQYVKSKADAENYIEKNIKDYRVIQLSFPFGRGESPQRLISRLINKIKKYEKLVINDFSLSLMPITQLEKDSCELILGSEKRIQYLNTNYTTLEEVVKFLYNKIGTPYNYVIGERGNEYLLHTGNLAVRVERFINPFDEISHMI